LPPLTDGHFETAFTVDNVTLPNLLPSSVPSLELVIPYRLGIVDLPAHALLRGHVLDPAYASCPQARSLFILDSIANGNGPSSPSPMPTTESTNTVDWKPWSDGATGIRINYPDSWSVQVTHNVGSIIEADFISADTSEHITLAMTPGETHWTDDADSAPPPPLAGNRQIVANAGAALARLVDVVGDETNHGHQRTVRLVLNYGGNTLTLSMVFVDGTPLNTQLLAVFSAMAASMKFDKPLGITDPMDPTLT